MYIFLCIVYIQMINSPCIWFQAVDRTWNPYPQGSAYIAPASDAISTQTRPTTDDWKCWTQASVEATRQVVKMPVKKVQIGEWL